MRLLNKMTRWVDHVTEFPGRRKHKQNDDGTVDEIKAEGKVLRQGTARSATNYNNLETSVRAANLFCLWMETILRHHQAKLEDMTGEYGEATLNNSKKYPFSNASVTVPLEIKRSHTDYTVAVEVLSMEGGLVEKTEVYDKQLNGFKIKYYGTAKKAKIRYCVTGGRTA